jgi:hypothetical protein
MAIRAVMWRPGPPPDIESDPVQGLEPRPDDQYWVIDDLDVDMVHIATARWPRVDDLGRLDFGLFEETPDGSVSTEQSLVLPVTGLHEFVSHQRSDHGQPAADRPIRVGDVFWFRGKVDPDAGEITGNLMDVTYSARQEAKASQKWAIAHTSPTTAEPQRVPVETAEEVETAVGVAARKKPSMPGATASPGI